MSDAKELTVSSDWSANVFSFEGSAPSRLTTERTTNVFSPVRGGWRWWLGLGMRVVLELLRRPMVTIVFSGPWEGHAKYFQDIWSIGTTSFPRGENLLRRQFARKEIVLLFIAADVDEDCKINVEKDAEAIREIFSFRSDVKVFSKVEIRAEQIIPLILRFRPTILHIDGHGNAAEIGVRENDGTGCRGVTPDDLRNVIHGNEGRLKLVYYDCCQSEQFAADASRFVESAIGMRKSISVPSAKIFASAFYQSLVGGISVERAFLIARDQLKMSDHENEMDTPCLYPLRDLENNETFVLKEEENVPI